MKKTNITKKFDQPANPVFIQMPPPPVKKIVKEFKQGDNSGMLYLKARSQEKVAKENLMKARDNYKKKNK
jgi:hypothetical protein